MQTLGRVEAVAAQAGGADELDRFEGRVGDHVEADSVALLDRRAGRRGNAPAYFATLRGPQFLLGCAGLAACWAWLVH